MKNRILISLLVVAFVCTASIAADLNVPGNYPTIQSAINAAADGDTVTIAAGTYSGFGNGNLRLLGKAITIRGADASAPEKTVIDCSMFPMTQGFIFQYNDIDCVVEGLTVTGASGFFGGAINVAHGAPEIRNCVLRDNSAWSGGGGVFNDKGSPLIVNTVISGNTTNNGGGGVYTIMGTIDLVNCVIAGNSSITGAGLYALNSDVMIGESVIVDNRTTGSPSAIRFSGTGDLVVENTVIWNNLETDSISAIYVANQGPDNIARFSYCDIQGAVESIKVGFSTMVGVDQNTNICADPLFVMAGTFDSVGNYTIGDFHLLKESPCIEAGDPGFIAGEGEVDIDGQARVAGKAVEIGVDEIPDEQALEVEVEIMPKTLNAESKGQFITAVVKFESEDDTEDEEMDLQVDLESIMLNDLIAPVRVVITEEGLMIKFDRKAVQELIGDEEQLELIIKGKTTDGLNWEGSDTIKIVHNNGKKPEHEEGKKPEHEKGKQPEKKK